MEVGYSPMAILLALSFGTGIFVGPDLERGSKVEAVRTGWEYK